MKEYTLKSGKILIVREAEESDAEELVEYIEKISGESEYLSFGPGDFATSAEDEAEILKEFRSSNGKVFLVGLIDGRIVCSLSFSNGKRPRMAHYGEFGMSVGKEHWGDGIGSVIMDSLITWARSTEIVTKINLQVRHDNHRAIGLYLKKGFLMEGTTPRGIRVNGDYFDVYWMGLSL